MIKAALYGLGTALPLVIGAAAGLYWRLPDRVLAALMAFGAGTMIAAVSSELFQPAFHELGGPGRGARCWPGPRSTSSPTASSSDVLVRRPSGGR